MVFPNIFSKYSVEKKPITIIADHREKNSLVCSHLVSQGFNIEFKQLPVADYLVNNVAIERKTISDFKSSIINKRIMRQLTEIKQYKKHMLILEGISEEDIYAGMHENAFRGFLLSVIFSYQIPIIYTKNAEDTARYLAVLAKKSPRKDFSLRASKIEMTEKERLQFLLEGFPGIGPINARKLLDNFKTIKSIILASEEDLRKIIGKKAERIIQLRDAKYK